MRKTTIFYGPRDSGKTTEARKLMSNGIEINHHSKNYTWMYNAVTPETKQLLFDDCKDTGMIKSILRSDFIEVKKQGKKPQLLPTPDLIFTVSAEVVSLADIESCLIGHWNVELVRTNPEVVSESLKDKILSEYSKGNIVFTTIDGLCSINIDEFIKQPAEGILYDLNRTEPVVLAFIEDVKWINDFAVAKTINALKEKIDELETKIKGR